VSEERYDVAIVGGGIVGLATALALVKRYRVSMVLLEAEPGLATQQTGHNSGVIHSGLYYKPGSLKARNCVEGRERMYRFCADEGIPHERCGKLVVATDDAEVERLRDLQKRGEENGLSGLRWLENEEIREREPHATGSAALLVPDTGIVDFRLVAKRMAERAQEHELVVRTNEAVLSIEPETPGLRIVTTGSEVTCRHLVNCAGLFADRVARLCGLEPGVRIVPFRGDYWRLRPERRDLVRNLIYPVPDPAFPFLGVHFTRAIDGEIEAGPNAVLAWARKGYAKMSFSPRDAAEILTYGGFWRLATRYWRTGVGEFRRSWSHRSLVRALRKLLPDLREDDIEPHGSGVRAQAVSSDGKLLDDFHILEAERSFHVLNAPSPAATASLSIGSRLAERAGTLFELPAR